MRWTERLVLLSALAVVGCTTASSAERDRQPLTFTVPAAEAEAAEARMREWIQRSAEDPILRTEDVATFGSPTYQATASLNIFSVVLPDGSVQYSVVPKASTGKAAARAERRARAAAYYIRTGRQ